ncbi:MAG: dihydropteroate synthase [Chloroflexi bacterium]|nr:dihydropteroate synthase [Chloroflexota bacterium]MCL5076109.1 dihydropteroate synthase [Chloroflexota bacterium]
MLIIGESIHIIAPRVRTAIEERDTQVIQSLALRQVQAGAEVLDLNIGPSKKRGVEIIEWVVDTVQAVTNVRLSLDTTNPLAMEAGLKRCRLCPIINSISAEQSRLNNMLPLAVQYETDVIALAMTDEGIPKDASSRASIALDLIAVADAHGIPADRLYLDPLVLPICVDQPGAVETIEAIRIMKQLTDPPPKTVVGLSNISNGSPSEIRGLINKVFLVMALGAGLDAAILDPQDKELMHAVRLVEQRDTSTPIGRLLAALYDSVANMTEIEESLVDPNDQEQMNILKTVRILQNQTIYAHSYLKV